MGAQAPTPFDKLSEHDEGADMYDDSTDAHLDAYLEAQYEDAYDFGAFDDDPNPYSGTYSEM